MYSALPGRERFSLIGDRSLDKQSAGDFAGRRRGIAHGSGFRRLA